MPWSLTIGRFGGTAVRVHITFIIFLAWIGFSAWQSHGSAAARDTILFIALIFACVVLHEFGHIFVARRFGIATPQVTLFPIGGIASMQRIPEKPAQELAVAIAGPLVNLGIAMLLFLALGSVELARLDDAGVSLLARLATANIFLFLFNLIPAFPMDGGRVLRALLAMKVGRPRATKAAATIGQGLAFVFGFLGLFGNPLLLFIAIFVYVAAAGEAQTTPSTRRCMGCASPMRWRLASMRFRSGQTCLRPWKCFSRPRRTSFRWWMLLGSQLVSWRGRISSRR